MLELIFHVMFAVTLMKCHIDAEKSKISLATQDIINR